MPSIETLLAFASVSALLALSPGPDNLFVLTQAASQGRRAGFLITLGLCSGLICHSVAVALGVAAIFQVSPWAFHALKIVGAIYLLYLAWQAWHAGRAEVTQQPPELSAKALYLRGLVMNLTNPKVAIFFLAFLPQFADPSRGSIAPQILVLGVVFMLCAWLIFSLIAALAAALGGWLRSSPRATARLNQVASLVFVGLALKLASSER